MTLTFLSLLPAPASAGVNLANGGFESGALTGWTATEPGAATVSLVRSYTADHLDPSVTRDVYEGSNFALLSTGADASDRIVGPAVSWWGDDASSQGRLPRAAEPAVAVAAGDAHNLALRTDGSVVAWGDNSEGQTTVPSGLTGVEAIAAGLVHSLALKTDGTVVAWGAAQYDWGQTVVPAGLIDVQAVAAGNYFSLALKTDGTVVAWGRNNAGQIDVPSDLTDVTAISAGAQHALALKSDGTVVAWGYNGYGQSNVPSGLTGVKAIAAGYYFSLALKTDGTVVAWGSNDIGETSVPSGLSGVTAIAAGWCHSLAVRTDGTVAAWGGNFRGETTVPTGLTGVGTVSAGGSQSLALKTDGTVVAWGANYLGQTTVPTDMSDVTAVALGYSHSLGLRSDGTVAAWGANDYGQTSVPSGLTGVSAVAAGAYHSLALKSDGTVVAWGDNSSGQSSVPSGLTGVSAIAAAGHRSLALKADGTVVAWGDNSSGQSSVPSDLTGVKAIAAGVTHSLAAKNDGTVVGWGGNWNGQASPPSELTGVSAIAAGYQHSLALKNDGTVVAWGDNYYGQISVPAGLTGVSAIAAGYEHSLALKNDGTVVAWGENGSGQSTVPAGLTGVGAIAAGANGSAAIRSVDPAPAPTTLSREISVGVGDTVSGAAFFSTTECPAYDDSGAVQILTVPSDPSDLPVVVATVFTKDVSDLDDPSSEACGAISAWEPWSYEFTAAGTYRIVAQVSHAGDPYGPSNLGLDGVNITPAGAVVDDCGVTGNIVTNCGSETGDLAGWTGFGDTVYTNLALSPTDPAPHGGESSFRVAAEDVPKDAGMKQELATTADITYDVKFYLYGTGEDDPDYVPYFDARVDLDGSGEGTLELMTQVDDFEDANWHEFTGQFTATGTSTTLIFHFYNMWWWYLDDISVAPQSADVGTETTLESDDAASVFGQLVTLTATVTPDSGTAVPTGTVDFYDGETKLNKDPVPVNETSGAASLTKSDFPVGTHSLTATYVPAAGNGFLTSEGSLSQDVNKAGTTTTIAGVAPAIRTYGLTLSFTTTVAPVAPGAGTPTGEVSYMVSEFGTTTYHAYDPSTDLLPAGLHKVKAIYPGDENFKGSTSAEFSVAVHAAGTTVAYLGDYLAIEGNDFTFKASVDSTVAGCKTGRGLTFTLLDGSSAVQSFTALSGAGGAVSKTVSTDGWTHGEFDVLVEVAESTDGNCTAADNKAVEDVITVASPGDAATGGGWYFYKESGASKRVNFGFTVSKQADNSYKGSLLLVNQGAWRLKGNLDSYTRTAAVGQAGGIGTLYQWVCTNQSDPTTCSWQNPRTVSFKIAFSDLAAGKGPGKKSVVVDQFALRSISVKSSNPPLPISALMGLKGGNIVLR